MAVDGEVRLEVVDLGQERLGGTLPREPLGEQARGLARSSESGWISRLGTGPDDTLEACRRP